MRNAYLGTVTCAVLLLLSSPALAGTVSDAEVGAAQMQMIDRVEKTVEKYATQIKMDWSYVSYCKSEMNLHTSTHVGINDIPFGVDYNKITDSEYLKAVITVREQFETSYLKLCLANAKNQLAEAARSK